MQCQSSVGDDGTHQTVTHPKARNLFLPGGAQTSALKEHMQGSGAIDSCGRFGCAHLKVLAVNTLAVVPAEDPCLEALAVLLQASRFLAVAAFVVAGSASHDALLL